jgi:hypothetical protein
MGNRPIIDELGKKYGKWLVVSPNGTDNFNTALWICVCECGNVTSITGNKLRSGKATKCKSCDMNGWKHGFAGTKEYRTWQSIKSRTTNPNATHYYLYGGRGIKMDLDWRFSFTRFFNDVGVCPSPEHSLDRIDNNGNYEPGNVRWATTIQQSYNKRNTIIMKYTPEQRVNMLAMRSALLSCIEHLNTSWSDDPKEIAEGVLLAKSLAGRAEGIMERIHRGTSDSKVISG